MKTLLTFDKAFHDLVELVDKIEDDKIQLDTLTENVKRANELIKFCEDSLRTIEKDVDQLKEGK